MATTGQHYDLADRKLELLEARVARVHEQRHNMSADALRAACLLLDIDAKVVSLHAQLAAVTE